MTRRRFLIHSGGAAGLLLAARAPAAGPGEAPAVSLLGPLDAAGRLGPLIHAPSDRKLWPEWRRQLAAWRNVAQRTLSYDDALYRREDLRWAARCFSCGFVMMCDEQFYDRSAGRYAIVSFLENGRRRFGGYDAIVLWHAYPRIGFDDRNQFDFYRDMPGGLEALRTLCRTCHAQAVRVFVNYNPWDTGTRRESKPDIDALASLVGAIDADGIFLDTLHKGAEGFRARLDAVRLGVVLESELDLPVEAVADHHLSWAQWFQDSSAPGVLRNQWFERRHRMHQIKRWHRDHTEELQTAWMNGGGMLVWENVFGSWIGWNLRDQSLLRAMTPIQRRYARFFTGEGWTPLVATEHHDIHASLWEAGDSRLWTLVNRSHRTVEGPLFSTAAAAGARMFDLIAGVPITPDASGETWTVVGRILPRGIGCFFAGPDNSSDPQFQSFLRGQRECTATAAVDTSFPERTVKLTPATATVRLESAPPGMVEIPPATVTLTTEFRSRECGFYASIPPADGVWGWAPLHQPRVFTRTARLGRYAIDITPVTNAEFARFLAAGGYRPRQPENYLKHWQEGRPPQGHEEHPVVYVSLDDARAYATWAGKRLPTEEEWQYAAAGPDDRLYPWGNEKKAGAFNDGAGGGTTPVTAFPAGRSPWGGYDFCGNVWHWTESERTDDRTRFCILKGGSWYKAHGSDWYADGGLQTCRFAAKFLLMWPGLDRCATIGFRCVLDLA